MLYWERIDIFDHQIIMGIADDGQRDFLYEATSGLPFFDFCTSSDF